MYGHTRRFHQAHYPWIFISVSCSWALVPIHVTSMEAVLMEDVIAFLDFMVMIAVYTNGCLGMITAYRRFKPYADPDAKKIDDQGDEEVLNKMPRNPRSCYHTHVTMPYKSTPFLHHLYGFYTITYLYSNRCPISLTKSHHPVHSSIEETIPICMIVLTHA